MLALHTISQLHFSPFLATVFCYSKNLQVISGLKKKKNTHNCKWTQHLKGYLSSRRQKPHLNSKFKNLPCNFQFPYQYSEILDNNSQPSYKKKRDKLKISNFIQAYQKTEATEQVAASNPGETNPLSETHLRSTHLRWKLLKPKPSRNM